MGARAAFSGGTEAPRFLNRAAEAKAAEVQSRQASIAATRMARQSRSNNKGLLVLGLLIGGTLFAGNAFLERNRVATPRR